MRGSSLLFLLLLLLSGGALSAGACELVLTHAEVATNRARAVEFFGPKPSTMLGYVVGPAGDLNGDGFGDVVLAAPYENSNTGSIFVVFGRSAAAWESSQFDFNATSTHGEPSSSVSWIKIAGTESNMFLGHNGVVPGDFNGDGLGDLLISANGGGKAFCMYGHSGTWRSFNTTEFEDGAVPGFTVRGSSGSTYTGSAGDLNGDGFDDLLVTVTNACGEANIIFGKPGASRDDFDVDSINGTNGFRVTDDSTALGLRYITGPVGDVNGDGLSDLGIGTYNQTSETGRAYIVFARNSSQWGTPFKLDADIDGANGFIVDGPAGSKLGRNIVSAGDVNADGFADIFISSSSSSAGTWLVLGHPAPWTTPLETSQIDGTNGFHFASISDEWWGISGGGIGDINGDGFDDFIVGAQMATDSTGAKAGAAAVLFGRAGSWPPELDRNDIKGPVGFLVDGPEHGSQFGFSVRGAGDVNGDGFGDFIAGAHYMGSDSAGYALLVFGADDHCAVCSNFTEECLVCDDGFIPNGTVCQAVGSSSSSSSDAAAVVVIETGSGGGSASEVAAEVAQLLGVDVGQVNVVEITPGTFEVTVINEEVAQQLVDLVEECMEEAESGQ